MWRYTIIISLGLLVSCAKNEPESPYSSTLKKAGMLCGSSASKLLWMENILKQSESDPAMSGDVYGIVVDGRTLFVHQPMVMSCLGCLLYDCEGKRIDMASVDVEAVIMAMTPENRIFDSH